MPYYQYSDTLAREEFIDNRVRKALDQCAPDAFCFCVDFRILPNEFYGRVYLGTQFITETWLFLVVMAYCFV